MGKSPSFGRAYYDRFYRDPRTRVTTPAATARLARFVCAYLAHLELPVHRILDLGCGLGYWRPALARALPRAVYHGVEASAYLCRLHGWERGSAVDYAAAEPFDLVVCQGVLQYLRARPAAAAIANLGRLCRGALYLEALTVEDWAANCDRERTDGSVHLRPAAWYRKALARRFRNLGGGLFLHRDAPAVLYALEQAGPE